ncbi:MAG: hypothetical protein WCU88_08400 [Elusimicrobiota bacterium]|jgi:hypothetical protein
MDDSIAGPVRELLTKWAAASPYSPCADLGQKLSLIAVHEKPAFVVRLITLYDVREALSDVLIPCPEDAPLMSAGADVWSQDPGFKKEFLDQEKILTLPTGDEPRECSACSGMGRQACKACSGAKSKPCPACTGRARKSCPQCAGKGKIACVPCKGTGLIVESVSAAGQEVRTRCPSCVGSGGSVCAQCADSAGSCAVCKNTHLVECADCRGKGELPCQSCGGNRRVLPGKTYKVGYQPHSIRDVRLDPETPDALLGSSLPQKPLGKTIYEASSEGRAALKEPLPDAGLQKSAEELLQRAEAAVKEFRGEARIIKQQLCVDRIPIYSAVYEYAGKKYYCWLDSVGGKVWGAESPFTSEIVRFGQEAFDGLSKEQYAQAEDLCKKVEGLGGAPWVAGVRALIAAARERRSEALGLHLAAALLAAAVLGMAVLHRTGHHVLWPLAAYASAIFIATAVIHKLAGPAMRHPAKAAGAAVFVAALGAGVFALLAPVRRADTAEFQRLLDGRFVGSIPSSLSSEDVGFVKALIEEYEALGVDVSPAKETLAANADRLEQARQEKLRQEALRQEELRRRKAEAEEQRRRAAAAAEAARKAKAKTKGKPVKKTRKGR